MDYPATDAREAAPASYLDRRGFLRSAAGGTAAIALASMIPVGCRSDYPQAELDSVELRALSPKEYATARAAADALLVGVPVDPGAIAASLDSDLAAVGDPVRSDFKTALLLVEHLTPLGFRIRRFTRLSRAARLGYLRGWGRSRFTLRRGVFQAVRAVTYYQAYSRQETWHLTGFLGPWPERIDVPAYPVDFGRIA